MANFFSDNKDLQFQLQHPLMRKIVELKELVLRIREKFNLSILLIEHDMGMVMSLSDRIYVMEYGSRIAAGTPDEIRHNPQVIRAYLGESEDA